MYRIVIVEREPENENLTEVFPWEKYEIQVVGNVQNDADNSYSVISRQRPDIVLMNTRLSTFDESEMVCRIRKELPDIVFIVLSAHGGFEDTSRAMALGIRHYILKPYDELQLGAALGRVKEEIAVRERERQRRILQWQDSARKIFSRAKANFFYAFLLSDSVRKEEIETYRKLCRIEGKVRLLSIRTAKADDYLHQFVISNIMGELLKDSILFVTVVRKELLILLRDMQDAYVYRAVDKLRQEYRRFGENEIRSVLSDSEDFAQVKKMYAQVKRRFSFWENEDGKILMINREKLLAACQRIKESEDIQSCLLEIAIFFAYLRSCRYSEEEINRGAFYLVKYLRDEKLYDGGVKGTETGMFETVYQVVETMHSTGRFTRWQQSGKTPRMEKILIAIYSNIRKRNLTLHWLSSEVLFMNEEYLGRIFLQNMNQKFSDYIFSVRMKIAGRLLQYAPDISIGNLAECVGYSADGQYFSKMFRKHTGMSPSEYKDSQNCKI